MVTTVYGRIVSEWTALNAIASPGAACTLGWEVFVRQKEFMSDGGAWHQMKSILFHKNRDFIHKITKLCVRWERDDKKKTFIVVYPTLCSISMLPVPFQSAADGILCHSQCPDVHNAMAFRIPPMPSCLEHGLRYGFYDGDIGMTTILFQFSIFM